ncbi:MAG: SDR family oxidoreductase [Bacteroidales bacterium]|nr:SDR family oxidoreductase [Bacteroidales bacterium]
MVILITGITSGFGKAMAERLSAEGHKVYGTHRKATEFIPGVTYIKAESTNQAEVEAAVRQVVDAEGRIDVFINNAGMGIGGPLEFCSIEDCQRQMDVNFMGMVRYIREVVPVMRKQGHGHIICFSSIGGLVGLPYQGMYSASKFAIEGYCEALRLEIRGFGINVTTIEPGDFATAFTAQRKSVDNPQVHEVYPGYARSLASIEHDENSGLKPEFLAKKISKIIRKKRPGYHYIISTFLQKLSVFARTILPPRWFAWVMSVYYKL